MSVAAENIDKTFITNVHKLLTDNSINANGIEIKPFASGGNNRVFILYAVDKKYLLKNYYVSEFDRRNRLQNEWGLLKYAEKENIACVPKPIACLPSENIAIYEFIEGQKLLPSEIDVAHIHMAADFVRLLNKSKNSKEALSLPNASEACFSIAEHVELIASRIEAIKNIDMQSSFQQVLEPIVQRIDSKFIRVCDLLDSSIGADESYTEKLSKSERCISPSDFGFHNALSTDSGKLYFIDFEYAGWDDPAKMIADFFCQPEVPVSKKYLVDFTTGALSYAADVDKQKFIARTRLLMPLFQLKWCCIMLNEFLPDSLNRRKFAKNQSDDTDYYQHQMNKVEYALKQIE